MASVLDMNACADACANVCVSFNISLAAVIAVVLLFVFFQRCRAAFPSGDGPRRQARPVQAPMPALVEGDDHNDGAGSGDAANVSDTNRRICRTTDSSAGAMRTIVGPDDGLREGARKRAAVSAAILASSGVGTTAAPPLGAATVGGGAAGDALAGAAAAPAPTGAAAVPSGAATP